MPYPELERRIGKSARDKGLITYTDLVKNVSFHLANVKGGQPFVIDEWTDLHRTIIGDFLGQVNLRSYSEHRFLASALVVDKAEGKPIRFLQVGSRARGTHALWIDGRYVDAFYMAKLLGT
jgi:hypothetical protein